MTAKAEPPPYDGPYLGALYSQTPVMSDMDWPKRDDEGRIKEDKKGGAVRIGYIRQGQKVPVLAECRWQPEQCPGPVLHRGSRSR